MRVRGFPYVFFKTNLKPLTLTSIIMRNIEELKPTIEYMKSLVTKSNKSDLAISIYIKTPNIFYKTQRVFIKLNDESAQDISKILNDATSGFNMRSIRNLMSIVYHYYFIDNMKVFSSPYYMMNLTRVNGVWSEPLQQGTDSPDPQDANGTVIR